MENSLENNIEKSKITFRDIQKTTVDGLMGFTIGIFSGILIASHSMYSEKEYSYGKPAEYERIVENAQIIETKGNLDYVYVQDKKDTYQGFMVKYEDVEESVPKREDLEKKYKKPFAVLKTDKEDNRRIKAYIYNDFEKNGSIRRYNPNPQGEQK